MGTVFKQLILWQTTSLLGFFFLVWAPQGLAGDRWLQPKLSGDEICTTCAEESGHDEIPRITIGELKEKMDSGADIVIVDAQPRSIYAGGHIKGALSLPWEPHLKSSDVKGLPPDKLIVIYCDCGPGEADSSDLAAQLREMGFVNVRVLADPSVRGWIKAGYPVER